MNEKYLITLELPAVLKLLAEEATLASAKESALSLKPHTSFDEVVHELHKTEEAFLLTAKYASPSFGSPEDPCAVLTRAEVGGVLNMGELLNVADALQTIRILKEWAETLSSSQYPTLEPLFSALTPNKFLEDKIKTSIKSPEEMQDNASTRLSEIRRKIRGVVSGIRDKLDKVVRSSKAKYLQEAIVTQRDDRFVVPVKAEFKSEIPGIVHDTSASGATLFIEPMPIVEANNEIRVLRAAEQEEIERILLELSSIVSSFSDSIKASFKVVTELNLIFAKSRLAYKMKASVPTINKNGRIVLKLARHPLIDKKSVVPISLSLGVDYNTLVITGPNTGGKTVALKTVGLLTVMTMCGMMIPANDGSEISYFDNILVDIGDEQSIQQSLSTFSSHMVNIVNILKLSTENALILVDELGGGTDPVEGAALAKAILIRFAENGAKVVATTHYAELKNYALETPMVENASCEFDVETLMPTYKLLIGVPGKSNAFAISEKLGVDKSIVSLAKTYISDDGRNFEAILESLEKARKQTETENAQVSALKMKLLEAEAKAEKALEEALAKKSDILEQATKDASYIIDNARYRTNSLILELEEIKKGYNKENAAEGLKNAKLSASNIIKQLEEESNPVLDIINEDYVLPRALVVGDRVIVFDINKQATIEQLSKDGKKAFVSIGGIKTWTNVSNLRLDNKPQKEKVNKKRTVSGIKSKTERDVRYEFDMRGMTVDEGIMELDRYIDQAVLSGIPSVTVIHGKGTGVLRKAVHQFLKENRAVKSYRLGVFGEGEAGVTIVEFYN